MMIYAADFETHCRIYTCSLLMRDPGGERIHISYDRKCYAHCSLCSSSEFAYVRNHIQAILNQLARLSLCLSCIGCHLHCVVVFRMKTRCPLNTHSHKQTHTPPEVKQASQYSKLMFTDIPDMHAARPLLPGRRSRSFAGHLRDACANQLRLYVCTCVCTMRTAHRHTGRE